MLVTPPSRDLDATPPADPPGVIWAHPSCPCCAAAHLQDKGGLDEGDASRLASAFSKMGIESSGDIDVSVAVGGWGGGGGPTGGLVGGSQHKAAAGPQRL